MAEPVSVIITTKNEQDSIGTCLSSIKNQSYKNIEIIVVDNASGDQTKQIALRFTNNVFNKGPERSTQRNFGAKKAKGKYVLFLDADMVVSPTVIEESVRMMRQSTTRLAGAVAKRVKNQQLYALVIPEKSIGSGYWTKCKILERMCYEGVDWIEAARFYDKDAFTALGGFDENLTGPEDFDLSQRVGAQFGKLSIGRIRSYIYHDEGVMRLGELLSKKYYYGKKMVRYMEKKQNSKSFGKQANPFLRYILFLKKPRLLLSDPIHAIGLFIMKTLELGLLGSGAFHGMLIKQ